MNTATRKCAIKNVVTRVTEEIAHDVAYEKDRNRLATVVEQATVERQEAINQLVVGGRVKNVLNGQKGYVVEIQPRGVRVRFNTGKTMIINPTALRPIE